MKKNRSQRLMAFLALLLAVLMLVGLVVQVTAAVR